MKAPREQASLFGEISPITGEPSAHPALCCCGDCAMPVERFGQPGAVLAQAVPEDWEPEVAA